MNRSRRRLSTTLGAVVLVAGSSFAAAAPAQAGHPGHTFYVAPTGSDTAAGSAAAPFQHIQRCATVALAGDTCRIASGTYRETVTPAHSGTASDPITFAAAPGATVVVTGTDAVTAWSQVGKDDLAALVSADKFLDGSGFADAVNGGHIYRAAQPRSTAQVFVDGAPGIEAQWPYPGNDLLNPNDAHAQSGTTTSLSDSALSQPDGYWTGARLTARNWFVSETGTVTGSTTGTVTASSLPGCVGLQPQQQTGYHLSGKLEAMTHAGEWFSDPTSHALYLWTRDGDSPSGHTVEAKARDTGIDLSGRSYITVTGLGLLSATAVTSASSSHDVLDTILARYVSAYADLAQDPNMVTTPDGCAVLTAGETTSGILLNGTNNAIRNSTVDFSAGNGVMLGGSHNTATNNTISHVDYMGSYAAGVNVVGSHETVTHNTVAESGRSDINLDWKVAGATAAGDEIGYNDLSGYNHLVNDGGAIYVCCTINLAGTVMDHNWLHSPAPGPIAAAGPAPGIYIDLGDNNATVYDNVAWDRTTYGVALFNGDSSTGNRVYNNTSGTDTNVVSFNGTTYADTRVENNIGNVDVHAGVTESNNIPFSTDPVFTDPGTNDFTHEAGSDYAVRASSPARNAGLVLPPATNGYRDRHPTVGAYQYGAPVWTAGATVNATQVQAERFLDNSGVARHAAGTGMVMGNFDGGDWIEYGAVDFGAGRTLFTGSTGEDPGFAGQQYQIRLDSRTGPVIATVTVTATGGFDTYADQSTPITFTTGVHDVFLTTPAGAGSGIGNLDYFTFSSPGSPGER